MKAEIVVQAGDDPAVDRLIDQASSAIVSFCNRSFAREAVVELLPGFSGILLQLERTPIITVSSVLFDTDVLTDWAIEDRDEGTLYRRDGWWWTRQVNVGLNGRQRWPGFGQPTPNSEEPRFGVTQIAGYILPPQFLEGVNTISALASDNSFNDSANGFPALLQAGDVVVASVFTSAANNGRFKVTGTPTTGKIQVAGTLVDEASGSPRTVTFEPPSECHPIDDLEKAAIETVKAWYLDRSKGPHTKRERVGDLDMEWTDPAGIPWGLPVTAIGLLRQYARTN